MNVSSEPESNTVVSAGTARSRKKMFLGLIIVVILAATVAAAVVYLMMPKLKTVTYNNGSGSTYKLLFYPDNTTADTKLNLNKKALVATKGIKHSAPLKLTISDAALTPAMKNISEYENCNGRKPVGTAYNTYAAKQVSICDAIQGDASTGLLYTATFTTRNRLYLATITQAVDVKQPAAKRQAGLAPYNKDIAKIVASIQPAQ